MIVWVPGPKGSDGRGLLNFKEDTMKLITRSEASRLSLKELQGLLHQTFNAVAAAPRGSLVRNNALASLDCIERELASRGPHF